MVTINYNSTKMVVTQNTAVASGEHLDYEEYVTKDFDKGVSEGIQERLNTTKGPHFNYCVRESSSA